MNMKKFLPFMVFGIVVLSLFLGTMFSVTFTDTTGPHFRQELSCGGNRVFEINDLKIEYTTQAVTASILDPDTDDDTECVPTKIKLTEAGEVIFHWGKDSGILTDKMSTSSNYGVEMDDYASLDNGDAYVAPNGYIEDVDFILHTNYDATTGYAFASERILNNLQPEFKRLNGFYAFDIDNDGHNNGRTTGSELYFHIRPQNADIDVDVSSSPADIKETNEINFDIISNIPGTITYTDICLEYETEAALRSVIQEECTGQSGQVQSGMPQFFTLAIHEISGDYKVGVVVKGVSLVVTKLTTSGVNPKDIERYFKGGKVFLGNLKTEQITITEQAVIEPPVDEGGLICPTVCVPMYLLPDCEYTECGSGCGADGVTSFETRSACLSSGEDGNLITGFVSYFEFDFQSERTTNLYATYGIIFVLVIGLLVFIARLRRKDTGGAL